MFIITVVCFICALAGIVMVYIDNKTMMPKHVPLEDYVPFKDTGAYDMVDMDIVKFKN